MAPDREHAGDEGDTSILGDENLVDTTSIGVTHPFTAHLDVAVPPLRTSDDDLDGGLDDDVPWSTDDSSDDADVTEEVAEEDVSIDSADIDIVTPDEAAAETETAEVVVDAVDAHSGDLDPFLPVRSSEPDTATSFNDVVASSPVRRAERRVRTGEIDLQSRRLGDIDKTGESADLLTADRLLDPTQRSKPEPEGAWQHFVYTVSGRRINLGDGRRARERKALDQRIAAPLPGGARFVPVLSRKGGVGKTTVTTLLGMALADARDDRVIAIDANPDRGTLADRIEGSSGSTVRDIIRRRARISGFNDISSVVARDETRLDVIASDSDPQLSEAFSDADYAEVAEVAAHYYSVVLTDTGTGIVHSVMGATLDLADQLVVVAGLTVDEARLASETLTWLEANGFEDKVRSAVVVLNAGRPGAPLVRASELESHFRSRVRTVVSIPYDAHIAGGSALRFRELQPETRRAARELAAAVVEGLRQHTAVL